MTGKKRHNMTGLELPDHLFDSGEINVLVQSLQVVHRSLGLGAGSIRVICLSSEIVKILKSLLAECTLHFFALQNLSRLPLKNL